MSLNLSAVSERVCGQRSSHPGIEAIRDDAMALIAEVEQLRLEVERSGDDVAALVAALGAMCEAAEDYITASYEGVSTPEQRDRLAGAAACARGAIRPPGGNMAEITPLQAAAAIEAGQVVRVVVSSPPDAQICLVYVDHVDEFDREPQVFIETIVGDHEGIKECVCEAGSKFLPGFLGEPRPVSLTVTDQTPPQRESACGTCDGSRKWCDDCGEGMCAAAVPCPSCSPTKTPKRGREGDAE